MKYLTTIHCVMLAFTLFVGGFSVPDAAAETKVQESSKLVGIITAVNLEKRVVSIRNNDTGKRHTYFMNERTQILANQAVLTIADLKPGQTVRLDFVRTDFGRELNLIRLPERDVLSELPTIDSSTDYFISGTVTGVRPIKRYITVHGPLLTQRMTLQIPEGVQLVSGEKPIKLAGIKKGQVIEILYRESEFGFTIISGEVSGDSVNNSKQ